MKRAGWALALLLAPPQEELVTDWKPLGGSPVSTLLVADDVDGDGVRDFLVGDARFDPGQTPRSGVVRLISGADSRRVLWEVIGEPGSTLGRPPGAVVGDVDGDGTTDYAVSTRAGLRVLAGDTGEVCVELPGRASWIGAAGNLAGGARDEFLICGSNRCQLHVDGARVPEVVYVPPPGGLRFGLHAALLGDLDGDGFPELAVADPGALEPKVAGRVVVFSGKEGTLLFERSDPAGDETFGSRVFAPGDVDGDGVPDLATLKGHELWLYSGRGGEPLRFFRARSPRGLIGDVDGDGLPELIGAHRTGEARVEVWSLGSGQRLLALPGRADHMTTPLDVNRDGVPELLLSEGDYPASYSLRPALPPWFARRAFGQGPGIVAGWSQRPAPGQPATLRFHGLAGDRPVLITDGHTSLWVPPGARRLALSLPASSSLVGANLGLDLIEAGGRGVHLEVRPGGLVP